MITIPCDQGSPQWFEGRAGAITASMVSECRKTVNGLDERQARYVELVRAGEEAKEAAKLAGYKAPPSAQSIKQALAGEKVGDYTDKAKQYAFKLAIERLSGTLLEEDTFETWQLRRGRELEPDARLMHEAKKGILVDRTGLVLTDDSRFGASVDGLIGDDGICEYKCFISPSSLMPILLDGKIDDCIDQVQCGLWITGRKWAHFVLYCPVLECINRDLTIIEVNRDDDYIEAMEQDLVEFDKLVLDYIGRLKDAQSA